MPAQDFWHTESNGELSAMIRDLRLVIRQCDGYARYLILHRGTGGNHPELMLGSGTESDVSKAMAAARRAAVRAEFILSRRPKMQVC